MSSGISIFSSDDALQHTSERHQMQLSVGLALLCASTDRPGVQFWAPGGR
jgi:hypothetical protein